MPEMLFLLITMLRSLTIKICNLKVQTMISKKAGITRREECVCVYGVGVDPTKVSDNPPQRLITHARSWGAPDRRDLGKGETWGWVVMGPLDSSSNPRHLEKRASTCFLLGTC